MKLDVNERIKINSMEGTIKYIGPIKDRKDIWVGILLDNEEGKNYGYIDDIEYFECNGQKKGVFVKQKRLLKDIKVLGTKEKETNYKKKYEKLKVQLTMIEALHNKKMREMKERYESVVKIKNMEIENLKQNVDENSMHEIENAQSTKEKKDFVNKLRRQTKMLSTKIDECVASIDQIRKQCAARVCSDKQDNLLDLLLKISQKLQKNENVDDLYAQFNNAISSGIEK